MSRTIASHFAAAKETVDWAKDAVNELDAECRRFFQSGVTRVVIESDPQSGEQIQKLKLTKNLPKVFRRKATEALHNARHSFDQATFACHFVTSGNQSSSLYFPWSSSPADLEGKLKRYGIDKRLWHIFEAEEPYSRGNSYPGGNDVMRNLAKIANTKHTVGLTINAQIAHAICPVIGVGSDGGSVALCIPKWDAAKNEAILARGSGDVQMQDNYSYAFAVIFKEPSFTKPVNAIDALTAFIEKADSFVKNIERGCTGLPT